MAKIKREKGGTINAGEFVSQNYNIYKDLAIPKKRRIYKQLMTLLAVSGLLFLFLAALWNNDETSTINHRHASSTNEYMEREVENGVLENYYECGEPIQQIVTKEYIEKDPRIWTIQPFNANEYMGKELVSYIFLGTNYKYDFKGKEKVFNEATYHFFFSGDEMIGGIISFASASDEYFTNLDKEGLTKYR